MEKTLLDFKKDPEKYNEVLRRGDVKMRERLDGMQQRGDFSHYLQRDMKEREITGAIMSATYSQIQDILGKPEEMKLYSHQLVLMFINLQGIVEGLSAIFFKHFLSALEHHEAYLKAFEKLQPPKEVEAESVRESKE